MTFISGIATGWRRRVGLGLFLLGLLAGPASLLLAPSASTGGPLDLVPAYIFLLAFGVGLLVMVVGIAVWVLAPVPDAALGEGES